VHPTDLHIVRGRYGFAPEFPAVLGVESVGTVDALGEGVESVEVGQRVVSVGITGTWQQYVVAEADRVLAVPDMMSASTAAPADHQPADRGAARDARARRRAG
jgi:NADPH:quinone reductase-like Zn-dependent oxidoreductase